MDSILCLDSRVLLQGGGMPSYFHGGVLRLFFYASFDELNLPYSVLLLLFGHALDTRWWEALRV